jgi:hypothetical protein
MLRHLEGYDTLFVRDNNNNNNNDNNNNNNNSVSSTDENSNHSKAKSIPCELGSSGLTATTSASPSSSDDNVMPDDSLADDSYAGTALAEFPTVPLAPSEDDSHDGIKSLPIFSF